MSIASEITRLQGVKADILTAIADKGVTVPAGSALDDCPELIGLIPTGGGGSASIGGRHYRTVNIGGVTWLAENLDFKFSGVDIGPSGAPSSPSAWYFNNDEATYGIDGTRKCGLLYNWYAVKHLNDNRSTLCPGWHVPTDAEWGALANAVGGTGIAGTRLKSVDNSVGGVWPTNWNGTDDYGFSALPSGGYGYGTFNDIGVYSIIWSINEVDATRAGRWYFSASSSITQSSFDKKVAYSIRLVKDTI
jgi:uncharacterized protein (TIGR02145 family)